MTDTEKASGLVTFLSTVGIVFGLIGLLGSFVPLVVIVYHLSP